MALPQQYAAALKRVKQAYAPLLAPLAQPKPMEQPPAPVVRGPEIRGGSVPAFLLRNYTSGPPKPRTDR